MSVARAGELGRAVPADPLTLGDRATPRSRPTRSSDKPVALCSVYVSGKVLEWVEEQGGVEEMARRSDTKAKLIYDAADQSDVSCPVPRYLSCATAARAACFWQN